MFRVSVILSVLFIVGITAKPWNKHGNEGVKKTVVAIDENGRPSWEVQPPKDMGGIQYEIDPRMNIWKNIPNIDPAAESQKHYISSEYRQKAEEDRDDIDHPVYAEVIAEEPQDSDEEDNEAREEVARYLAPLLAGYKAEVGGAPHQPEVNEDQVSPAEKEAVSNKREGGIHLQPEEDMDALYHKEVLVPAFYQDDTKAAAPVHLPSQRKYSEPEVDLDHIYHK